MTTPITPELVQKIAALTPTELAWLSGYAWARSQSSEVAAPLTAIADAVQAPARRVTVLSASQTGNARRVAEQLLLKLESTGVNAKLVAAADYKTKQLAEEDILLLVASTQGEGEPPEEAVPLHKFLFGKKTPDLSKLSFTVLGLGDSSYPNFCQAGKDFDAQLAQLGGKRLHDLGICDLDFQAAAESWSQAAAAVVAEIAQAAAAPAAAVSDARSRRQNSNTAIMTATPTTEASGAHR